MSVMTWTRGAKCSDCKFLTVVYKGKLKRHKCGNPQSPWHEKSITLRDLVCNFWKWIYEKEEPTHPTKESVLRAAKEDELI